MSTRPDEGQPNGERERIMRAGIEVAARYGYHETTIEMVAECAGISEATFGRNFADWPACFHAGVERANRAQLERGLTAFQSAERWRDRLYAVGLSLVRFIQEDPDRGRVLCIEAAAAGGATKELRDQTMQAFVELVDAGRAELPDPESVPRSTAEGIAGAVYEQLAVKLNHHQEDSLDELIPQLMCMAVMPYLGMEAALRELDTPSGASVPPQSPSV